MATAAILGKKQSMFKSPDVVDGKVGVTNSGRLGKSTTIDAPIIIIDGGSDRSGSRYP